MGNPTSRKLEVQRPNAEGCVTGQTIIGLGLSALAKGALPPDMAGQPGTPSPGCPIDLGTEAFFANHPVTVLHIDDDPNDTELLRVAFRRSGLRLVLDNVEDAEGAVAYLAGVDTPGRQGGRDSLALILLDIKMPRVTGFDILRWIRGCPACRAIPVVVLSGCELEDDVNEAYAVGADSYYFKPLRFEELVALIKSISATWLLRPPAGANTVPLADDRV